MRLFKLTNIIRAKSLEMTQAEISQILMEIFINKSDAKFMSSLLLWAKHSQSFGPGVKARSLARFGLS